MSDKSEPIESELVQVQATAHSMGWIWPVWVYSVGSDLANSGIISHSIWAG